MSAASEQTPPGDFVLAIAQYRTGDWDSARNMTANLIDSVARYTSLPIAPLAVDVDIGSDQIFDYPFIWMSGHIECILTDRERNNLKQFVERGGFFVIDDHNHDLDGVFHKTASAEIQRLFGKMQVVSKEHPIYHCFFEFSDGSPATMQEMNGWGDNILHRDLHAVMYGDRIGLLYSNRDYTSEWTMHPDTKRELQPEHDTSRFGVNLIIYALTR